MLDYHWVQSRTRSGLTDSYLLSEGVLGVLNVNEECKHVGVFSEVVDRRLNTHLGAEVNCLLHDWNHIQVYFFYLL